MTSVIEKLRNILEDNYQYNQDTFVYTTSKIFTLSYANVDSSSIVVEKNGAAYSASNYSYSSSTGKLTITGSLNVNDVLVISYNFYEKYSDADLRGYIRNSLYYISLNRYKTFTAKSDNILFPTPTEDEENLIAIIAGFLANGNIQKYDTPDIKITYRPEKANREVIKELIDNFESHTGAFSYMDLSERVQLDDSLTNEEE